MTLSVNPLFAFALAAFCVSAVDSFAQDAPSCSCSTPYQGPSERLGAVLSSQGNVMMAQKAGYAKASSGSPLSIGSRVVVGAQSAAILKVGQLCQVDLTENTSADISLIEDNVCVNVTEPFVATHGLTNTTSGPRLTPAGLFGLMAAGSVIFSVTSESTPVSD